MEADGYSLDDKRTKQDCHGDLQDIVEKFQSLKPGTKSDRKLKHFTVPYADIKKEDFDLSFSRYHEDVYEEIQYEAPSVILDKLIEGEVGDVIEQDLAKIKSGIVRELLELREMIG
jgi:type I restriction enzyme M protein